MEVSIVPTEFDSNALKVLENWDEAFGKEREELPLEVAVEAGVRWGRSLRVSNSRI